MRAKASLWLTAALVVGLSAVPLRAAPPVAAASDEAGLRVLLDTIRANRKDLIAVNLNLSADEGAKFWPLYDRYQAEISATGDRAVAIVEDYTTNFRDLSNDKALQLMGDYLAAEADRVAVRRTYLPEFAKVLPGRTVARFYQIENKMDAIIRYDLAATIPVIDEAGTAPPQ
ncbi:MAG: hypothetical protein ACRERC_08170 [Candidatus Binatia bacterium]